MSSVFTINPDSELRGNYRLMRNEDVAEVYAIDEDIYPFPWTEGIFRDCITAGQLCVVHTINNEIVAYGIVGMMVDEAHILNLSVRRDMQGKGLGREMMIYLLNMVKQGGAVRVILEVRPSNQVAVNLYHSLGFIQIGLRKEYYPDFDDQREDAIVLALEILSEY